MSQQNRPRDPKSKSKGDASGARSRKRGVYGDILISNLETVDNDSGVTGGDDINNVAQDSKESD